MIEDYSFGMIAINGVSYTSDIKIIEGKVITDWWRQSGHRVTENDITDILENKPDILVIGKGQPGYMKSTRSLRGNLRKRNIELIEEETSKAIQTFNRLYKEGEIVSAGFHLTC